MSRKANMYRINVHDWETDEMLESHEGGANLRIAEERERELGEILDLVKYYTEIVRLRPAGPPLFEVVDISSNLTVGAYINKSSAYALASKLNKAWDHPIYEVRRVAGAMRALPTL